MKTFSARYKGNRVIQLLEDIDSSKDPAVLVIVPEQPDLSPQNTDTYQGLEPSVPLAAEK